MWLDRVPPGTDCSSDRKGNCWVEMSNETRPQVEAYAETTPRAFVVVDHLTDGTRGSQVVVLPDGVDVTFGRSVSSAIHIDDENVSRTHARLRRSGAALQLEDLGSRTSTRVNGERISGVRRLASGVEITIGSFIAVVSVTSTLRKSSPIADCNAGELRLAAEVDRSVRYHRPLTLALVHIASDDAVEAVARSLRTMDVIAEHAGDEYIVILPELDRATGKATVEQLREIARATGEAAFDVLEI